MNRLQQMVGVIVLIASPALADTYNFTDLLSNAGAAGLTGTVTVTQTVAQAATGTVEIKVTGNFLWANTGSGSSDEFFFNLVGNPTLSASAVTFVDPTMGWTFTGGPVSGIPNGSSLKNDFKYAVSCAGTSGACAGGGTSSSDKPPLVFDVTRAGLTPDSFFVGVSDSPYTVYFAADAGYPTVGQASTGLVGATLTSCVDCVPGGFGNPVPDGGMTLVLLGGALVGVESLRRRLRL